MTPGTDAAFVERALLLAERGRGLTTPNPLVGAVVVDPAGIVVGHGAHLGAGRRHAEIVALDEAGPRARGATLFCTLEPCAHVGRTGPCVERIVAAGIRRVVVGVGDPNPLVSGRGFDFLRAHGVDVRRGVLAEEASTQLAPFATWVTTRRPFVIAKVALSADGFVGRPTERVRLTGPEADRFFHRQRAEIDGIAVGAGTVLVDDPVLTPRGAFRARPLTRVVFDWRGRVPVTARVFSTLETGPVIMVVTAAAVRERPRHFDEIRGRGVTIDVYEARDLRQPLARLAARDVVTLLVEGGPGLHRALAAEDLIDRVQVVQTPVRLEHGVVSGVTLTAAPRRTRTLGRDVFVEVDVHRVDRNNGTH